MIRRHRQRFIWKILFCMIIYGLTLLIPDDHPLRKSRRTSRHDTLTSRRHLLASNESDKPCTYSSGAVEEFPTDLFTQKEREKGAIILHIITLFYTFGLLAVVCDDYFV